MLNDEKTNDETKRGMIVVVCLVVVGLGIILTINLLDTGSKGTGVPNEPATPIVRLPEQVVKELLEKGIDNVAYLDHDGKVKQVLELYQDGTCEACQNEPELQDKWGLLKSKSSELSDIVVSRAYAYHCPNECMSCSTGKCRKRLGKCCNC